jgi:MFS family permease
MLSGLFMSQNSKARFALTLLLLINLLNYIDRYILSSTIAGIEKDLLGHLAQDERKAWGGMLATCFMVSFMVFAPIFGYLVGKISRWYLIGGGIIFWSLASGLSGISGTFSNIQHHTNNEHLLALSGIIGTFTFLAITRCMVGIGEAAYGPIAPTILSDYYPQNRRGMIISIFYVAIPVGSAMGYTFGAIVGWPDAFYWVIPPGLILGIICFFQKDPNPECQNYTPTNLQINLKSAAKTLFKIPSYVLNCLGMTANTFAIGGIAFWLPNYVTYYRQFGTEKETGTWIGGIIILSGLGATLTGGFLADYLKKWHKGSYFTVSGIGMFVGFPAFLSVLFVPFPAAWFFVAVSCFCLFLNTGPTNTILLNVSPPAYRSMAFAINIFMIHAFGDAISPWVIGLIADKFATGGQSNFNAGFICISAMILLGGLFWILGGKYLEKDTQAALQN